MVSDKGIEMKLIQIFALVTALAVAATAQNTNGQAGSTSQTPASKQHKNAPASTSKTAGKSSTKGTGSSGGPITLTVPKSTNKTAPGSTASAPSKTPATSNTSASKTAASKTPAAKTPATQSSAGASGTAKKSAVATPTAKGPIQSKSVATANTGKQNQAKVAQKKTQVKVVGKGTTAAKGGKPVDANKAIAKISANGRRDPFMSVIRNLPISASAPSCSVPGKKCLYIPELVVKGIAKDPDGQMLAVVEGGAAHRAYFLRENDQVFNGNVEKITSDSVVFREFATDNLGRESAHEVVKKIPKS
jgi:hypothetical protein